MQRIIYFLSSHQIGLTSLLTNSAIGLHKLAPDKFLFVCGEKEQFEGLLSKLENASITPRIIRGLDEHKDIRRLIAEFRSLVEEYKPDVVHAQTNWQLAIAAAVKIRSSCRYSIVYTIHGYRHNLKLGAAVARAVIGAALYCLADGVIAPSNFVRHAFSFVGKKVKILFLGVDDIFFETAANPDFSGKKKLYFAGQFRRGKNQDLLIRAVYSYIAKTGDNNIEIYLPGEGERRTYCMDLAASLGIADNVHFPGQLNRQEIVALLSKCQFALIPTNNETFGHCIAEPAVMGRVVITRPVGVAPDFIVDGKNGFYFDTEKDLVDVLIRALQDERICMEISENIKASADIFRWDSLCKEYLKIIQELSGPNYAAKDNHDQPVVAIIWQRFLPYHLARIRRAAFFLRSHGIKLIAIEVATQDTSYGFPPENAENEPPVYYNCCFPGVNYHSLSAAKIHDAVFNILQRLEPDVVFAPATPFPEGMAAIHYRTEQNKKAVMMDDLWAWTAQSGFFKNKVKSIIHSNVDAVFIPAPSHAPNYLKSGFSEDRIVLGVDVVDNDYFLGNTEYALKNKIDISRLFSLPADYFLFVGRLIPEKGLSSLMEAYMEYRATVKENAWDLVIVGSGGNPDELKKMYSYCQGIHFPGAQFGSDLCYHYALARALVVPSLSDQWGLVINEGMACGLPVIASRGCGATATLVQDGDNGWTFRPGNVIELARCMLEASGAGSDKLTSMGNRSREIIAHWSTKRFAEAVFEAIQIPRRQPAGLINDIVTRIWKGHVRTY